MKFSDVILAVATGVLIYILLYSVFGIALIGSALGSYWGQTSTAGISLIVAALVVGFAFAGKIQEESRIRAVGKIAVLLTAVLMFLTLMTFSANSYYGAYVKQTLQNMTTTSAWTTTDWMVYVQYAITLNMALDVVLSLVVSFIGLYIGSMFRKSKKS